MITRLFIISMLALACGPIQVLAGESALDAANVLPEKYRSKIIKISADNGTPNPAAWYFLCRTAHSRDGILSITVQDGSIVQQKPSLDLRALAGEYSRINLSKVAVDSRGAFEIARRYCNSKGTPLVNASYALQQQGSDATPIWSVWCYDRDTRYIGLVRILASTGDVISAD
ncbi:MAG: hypothetical protein Fur0032_13830 [Terrimicrobiaceae bacterium]